MDGGDMMMEKKKEEDEGPNGCLVCLEATWKGIYVSNLINLMIIYVDYRLYTVCSSTSFLQYVMDLPTVGIRQRRDVSLAVLTAIDDSILIRMKHLVALNDISLQNSI